MSTKTILAAATLVFACGAAHAQTTPAKPAAQPAKAAPAAKPAVVAKPAAQPSAKPAAKPVVTVPKADAQKAMKASELIKKVESRTQKITSLEEKLVSVEEKLVSTEGKIDTLVTRTEPKVETAVAQETGTSAQATPVSSNSTPAAETADPVYDATHKSYVDGIWNFELQSYAMKCDTKCGALADVDQSKQIKVFAKPGIIEFDTKSYGRRSCQVRNCAPVQ